MPESPPAERTPLEYPSPVRRRAQRTAGLAFAVAGLLAVVVSLLLEQDSDVAGIARLGGWLLAALGGLAAVSGEHTHIDPGQRRVRQVLRLGLPLRTSEHVFEDFRQVSLEALRPVAPASAVESAGPRQAATRPIYAVTLEGRVRLRVARSVDLSLARGWAADIGRLMALPVVERESTPAGGG